MKYRTLTEAGKDDPSIWELKKGPNGRNLCRVCEAETLPPRRTFCSQECVIEWKIRNNPRFARSLVRKRDKGICATCGLDCIALQKELKWLSAEDRRKRVEELDIPKHRMYKSLWDMDHIIEVVDGGGCCSLENLRILCWKCHLEKTKEQRLKRKKEKDVR